MKNLFPFFIFTALLFASCKSKTASLDSGDAKALAAAIKGMQPGGGNATTDGGWTMTAKIDGKAWKASSIMSPERAGRILGENNVESISLPYYDKRNFLALMKRKFGGNHSMAEMRLNDDVVLWTTKSGEMEITKVDDKWAEGKFSFTASGFETEKTKEVTDGFFRISIAEK